MGDPKDVGVVLPADVQQIDGSGFVWTFLDEASVPAFCTRARRSLPATRSSRSSPESSRSSSGQDGLRSSTST
jgi:hypothetical protein